ncbi:MAG: hypothetical protein Q9182_000715 [Xanthomendoza sp. 2 TL-2023]
MASLSALQELLLAIETATSASSLIPCHPETDTSQGWGQEVIDSTSSLLAGMKHRRAAQRNAEEFLNDTDPDSSASKSTNEQADAPDSMEPVILRERLVFRRNVPIDADSLISLHQSHKEAEALINKFLISKQMERDVLGGTTLSCLNEDYILLRCALREKHEAR